MGVIRNEQKEALAQQVEQSFEDRVVAHLQKCFPDACRALGPAEVRESVRRGITRAAGYGVKVEYDVVRFIDLMYTLCQDFDTNRQTPWAGEILNEPDLSPRARMDKLYERTLAELERMQKRGPQATR